MKSLIDEIISGLSDAAKAKVEEAVKDAIEEKVKQEIKKLRRRMIRRVIITGAVVACGYIAYTRSDDIKRLVSEKVQALPEALQALPESLPIVIVKK